MKTLRLKLEKGSDIKFFLENLSKKTNIDGFVLGIVGDLSTAVFQCPKRKGKTTLKGNLEIITLNGSLSPDLVHLHLSISDTNCQVWGGHLEHGSIVLKGAEILIGITSDTEPLLETKLDSFISRPKQILEVATLPNCPWSAKIIRTLESKGIPYKNIRIEDDALFKIIRDRSGSSTFPQVFFYDKYIGGYTEFLSLFSSGKLFEN